MTDLTFPPNARRAAQLDQNMLKDLGASLRHVVEQARGQIAFDRDAIAALIARLERGERHPPLLFALYYELVDAVIEERWDNAEERFRRLAAIRPAPPGLQILALNDTSGADGGRYRRLMCSDESLDINFLEPDADKANAFRARILSARRLLDRAAPELAGEVGAIINEIVLVAGDPKCKMQFDGGSHFQLWGSLFLNTDFHPTELAVVEVIAHESAHSLLHGFCRDENLVENDEEERFASPLRVDPRPMHGIYHAAFVSARMHWAMSAMIDSGVLDTEAKRHASDARDADARNFAAGYSVVRKHGRLTPLGERLISGAADYIRAASAG